MRWTSIASLFVILAACGAPEIPVTGGFRETVIDEKIRHGQGIRLRDLDGDGDLDLVAALSLTDAVHVYLNPSELGADAILDPWTPISITGPRAIVAMDVAVDDYDGDGDLDVAAVGLHQRRFGPQSPGQVTWFENPGDPTGVWIERPITGPNLYGPRALRSADLDGDGRVDLLVGAEVVALEGGGAPTFVGGGVAWLKNEGGRFSGPYPIDPGLQDVRTVLSFDVDGDGRLDVIAAGTITGAIFWYQNRVGGDGSPHFVRYTVISNAGAIFGLEAASFGDDQTLQIAAGITRTGTTSVQIFQRTADVTAPWTPSIVVANIGAGQSDDPRLASGDFDGDGRIDLTVTTYFPGDLVIFRNEGGGVFSPRPLRGGYGQLAGVATGDIDGDGRLDVVTSTFELGLYDRLAWWRATE